MPDLPKQDSSQIKVTRIQKSSTKKYLSSDLRRIFPDEPRLYLSEEINLSNEKIEAKKITEISPILKEVIFEDVDVINTTESGKILNELSDDIDNTDVKIGLQERNEIVSDDIEALKEYKHMKFILTPIPIEDNFMEETTSSESISELPEKKSANICVIDTNFLEKEYIHGDFTGIDCNCLDKVTVTAEAKKLDLNISDQIIDKMDSINFKFNIPELFNCLDVNKITLNFPEGNSQKTCSIYNSSNRISEVQVDAPVYNNSSCDSSLDNIEDEIDTNQAKLTLCTPRHRISFKSNSKILRIKQGGRSYF